jgi:hypothetical protein
MGVDIGMEVEGECRIYLLRCRLPRREYRALLRLPLPQLRPLRHPYFPLRDRHHHPRRSHVPHVSRLDGGAVEMAGLVIAAASALSRAWDGRHFVVCDCDQSGNGLVLGRHWWEEMELEALFCCAWC